MNAKFSLPCRLAGEAVVFDLLAHDCGMELRGMFEELRFKWRLSRIRRSDRKWIRKHHKEYAEEKKRNATREELENLDQDFISNMDLYEDAVAKLETNYLLEILDKLMIPRPDFILQKPQTAQTATWMESKISGVYLTPKARLELRDIIRKEQKERSEVARLWMGAFAPLIAALTGFVGALIGALALFGGMHK